MPTRTEQAEIMAAKIDSWESYRLAALAASLSIRSSQIYPMARVFYSGIVAGVYLDESMVDVEKVWPHHRELYRRKLGVYPQQTEVMAAIESTFALGGFHINVSREDPSMVAFSPSFEDLQRDRQVRTSFGKLLRKLVPTLVDSQIQQLEAQHRAELDPHFEVAHTADDIYWVYTNMPGDSGCMRHPKGYWSKLGDSQHPSTVYAAPGMGVAWLKDAEGKVRSRAVIWDNPADPEDKRFVRIYGDAVLSKKLVAAGYTMKWLVGAKLAAVNAKDSSYYVLPYLDGPGGNQNDMQYVAKFDDENYLTLLDRNGYNKLVTAGGQAACAKTQDGCVAVPVTRRALVTTTDILTGQTIDLMDNPGNLEWVYHQGVIGQSCVIDRCSHPCALMDYTTGRTREVFMTKGDFDAKVATATIGSVTRTFIRSAANYAHFGLCLLSERLGYAPGTYAHGSGLTNVGTGDDAEWSLSADVYKVFDAHSGVRWVYKSEVPALKKSGYVSAALLSGDKVLCHSANPKLVTLVNGKKAVAGQHEITELHDGRWDYTRNTVARAMFGVRYAVSRPGAERLALAEVRSLVSRAADKSLAKIASSTAAEKLARMKGGVCGIARQGYEDFSTHRQNDGTLYPYGRNNSTVWEQYTQAAVMIQDMSDKQLGGKFGAYAATSAKVWAQVILDMDALLGRLAAEADAEAAAQLEGELQPA